MLKKVNAFLSEVRVEMRKVTWPTRDELTGSTMVVLATMFIVSAFVGVCDLVFSVILSRMLR
ncbi:MAG: preprotein translocase subunit SecE [Omnitrophica bacterium RIFCSPHIGHO2_02_FULL_63_14]|nr:MAG: preprotein translocase subunit SecE [Omnitrophica bacterium RIFCSPHIGHO2_02_FULL_63_14]